MRQNPCPVNSLPFKGIVWHFVKFIPADLRRHKISDATFFHNLRQSSRVAEYIRKPENLIVRSEFLPEKALAIEELAHERLTGSQVAVCLEEHAALGLPASLFYPLFDLLVDLRCVLFYIFIKLWLAGHKLVLRILAHQLKYRREAPDRFILCHRQRPFPRHINVRMSNAVHLLPRHSRIPLIKFLIQIVLRCF